MRACPQEIASSCRLSKLARSGPQMIKYFSHRHKFQRFEAGLKRAACFKIFQVTLYSILASFKCQMCLLSSVLSLLFGSLQEDLWLDLHSSQLAYCPPLSLWLGRSRLILSNYRLESSELVDGSFKL